MEAGTDHTIEHYCHTELILVRNNPKKIVIRDFFLGHISGMERRDTDIGTEVQESLILLIIGRFILFMKVSVEMENVGT